MRRLLTFSLLSIPLSIAIACGSSEEEGGGTSGPYEPPGNGVAVGESQACEALDDARQARATALNCGPITSVACPGSLQSQKGTPPCSQYDQGALQGCLAYIGGFASCNEVKTTKCIVKPIPNSAPNGCPAVVDSGVDAGQDASEDAGEDVEIDATEDVVVEDVAPDVDDAASDAVTE